MKITFDIPEVASGLHVADLDEKCGFVPAHKAFDNIGLVCKIPSLTV